MQPRWTSRHSCSRMAQPWYPRGRIFNTVSSPRRARRLLSTRSTICDLTLFLPHSTFHIHQIHILLPPQQCDHSLSSPHSPPWLRRTISAPSATQSRRNSATAAPSLSVTLSLSHPRRKALHPSHALSAFRASTRALCPTDANSAASPADQTSAQLFASLKPTATAVIARLRWPRKCLERPPALVATRRSRS